MYKRESCNVLQECIDLQERKAKDYQNENSNVKQADHYRRGVDTIHDMISQKLLRAQSLLESGGDPNFESLEDTYKDMINYASFAVSYLRGKMEGQNADRDIFNKKVEDVGNTQIFREEKIVPAELISGIQYRRDSFGNRYYHDGYGNTIYPDMKESMGA